MCCACYEIALPPLLQVLFTPGFSHWGGVKGWDNAPLYNKPLLLPCLFKMLSLLHRNKSVFHLQPLWIHSHLNPTLKHIHFMRQGFLENTCDLAFKIFSIHPCYGDLLCTVGSHNFSTCFEIQRVYLKNASEKFS